jgi:glycosyltransferase involved in cell wall biosynthesis
MAESNGGAPSDSPRISVVVPCYNEEQFIGPCLDSVLDPYVLANTEILVIDGRSPDRTRDIVSGYARRHPIVRLLDNPDRLQSAGLNVGLAAARGQIIVRLDAHSTYPPSYVETCVRLLERMDAANVGGVMEPVGSTPFTDAVARAMMHPLGIGNSKFHHGNFSGYVDTCYLGTLHRDVFDRVGTYDPNAHPAEDAELNCRILESGRRIYLDSAIRVRYQPRASWAKLATQFFWYGRGRCYVIQKHLRLMSLGRLAPPLLVLGILSSLMAAIWWPAFLLLPAAYLLGAFATGFVLARGAPRPIRHGFLQGLVLATMHLSYGTGFLLRLTGLLH